jgi:hypothetical protein
MHREFRWENQKESHHWERLDVDVRMILKLILEKQDRGYGLDLSGSV